MTRELDIKVAEALGWTRIRYSSGYENRSITEHNNLIGHSSYLDQRWRKVPAYSSDYAALPEMLAHLVPRGVVDINSMSDDGCYWGASVDDGEQFYFQSRGATVVEAVARLVVAVAEAKQ